MILTAEKVRETWNYDPETGYFTWLASPRYKINAGDRAGWLDSKTGYWRLRIGGRTYKASRVAWFYMTGEWPKDQIDHVDGIKTNDAFANLREANNQQNCCNRKSRIDNALGVKGVHLRGSRYIVQVRLGKKYVRREFLSLDEAAAFYREQAVGLHGDFARA